MTYFSDSADTDRHQTQQAILEATHQVLLESGYNGISISRIADRVGISKSVIYHYYDNKESLLAELLDAVHRRFLAKIFEQEDTTPREELERFLTLFVAAPSLSCQPETELTQLAKAFVELRTQSISNPDYRSIFTESENRVKRRLTETIEAGIEQGEFKPVDPERTSEHIITFVAGILFRQATTDSVDSEALYDEVQQFLADRIYV
ncbi:MULTISPECIES: TetR/AcrR family transcriptional regulator [Haloferax]|uniref:Fatty acid metabolism regulator protein n=1 Tax=Haloferax massiliensis TaxID=1476858 RepID=A0A0D6JM60_9EURY|nr:MULTISPECIES: TetR/AcrR family transcriptional regulator [Haloferax]MDS0243676.1 TetR/AcrR family transcriptional regulator [Haloferax sp. S2CR25]MDS0446797.1 TetR/AcrR family transcriptional regulator [Haloferax sp. S2CR25-2]CQR48705.1 Fatty acid metabolism regulator protein [Haloferax massiliensis]